jgi:acyl-coenzyme A synthetase/AMP-(fatty) acid ligase
VAPHTLQNLLQVRHSIKDLFDLCDIDAHSRLLCSAKFSFVWGFCAQLLAPLLYGTTNMIVTSTFNYKNLAAECQHHNITNLIVNPYLLKLFNSTTVTIPPAVKSVCVGGEVLSASIANDFVQKFNVKLINCYGLTESLFTIIGGVFDAGNPRSIGQAFETVQIKVVDDQGQPVPPGVPGRLAVKTLHQADQYCHNHEHSAQVFVDGWIYTSDLVSVDQAHNIVFLGRLNSCVKFKGEWHSLSLIEDLILKIDGVDDCVVFQSVDAHGTPELSSIVSTQDHAMTRQHVQSFLKSQNQKKFLIPSNVQFVQELPRTANMKKIRSQTVLNNLLQQKVRDVVQQ